MKRLYSLQRIFILLIATLYNKLIMKVKCVKFGKRFRTCGRVFFCNEGRKGSISIGDGVNINSLGTRNPGRVEGITMLITTRTGRITIGNNVGMSNCILYSASGINIGDESTIGAGTKLIDTDGPCNFGDDGQMKSRPIIIGKRVFIGGNVIVLKGVTIGDEAVVGSGAVVTKNIGPREIWCGNPAKCIKRIE